MFCRDMTEEGFAAFNTVALLIHKPVKFHNKTCQSCPTSQRRFHRVDQGLVWASGQVWYY